MERGVSPQLPVGHPATALFPQSEDQEEIQDAVRACSRLFGALLERGELFVGQLPPEEMVMAGERPGRPGPHLWQGWGETLSTWEETSNIVIGCKLVGRLTRPTWTPVVVLGRGQDGFNES